MKIVGIISSSHYSGNSATLVREALKGAEEEGASVKEIYLPQFKIGFCTGCMKCLEGKCPLTDDFEALKDLLYDADGIIWSSPTFAAAPNAIMKNFIDRLGMFERFTSLLGGKYVAGISTAASMGARQVAKNLAGIASNGVFQRAYVSGILGVRIGAGSVAANPVALKKARCLGRKIAQDIKNGKKYRLQNLFGRLINGVFLKSGFSKVILKNKEGKMKAIYHSLSLRGLI